MFSAGKGEFPFLAKSKHCLLISLFLLSGNLFYAQEYQGFSVANLWMMYEIELDNSFCGGCSITEIAPAAGRYHSFTPDGELFCLEDLGLYQVDPLSGSYTLALSYDYLPQSGLFCVGGGVCYSIKHYDESGLYRSNVNSDQVTFLGNTGYPALGDIAMLDGEIYYSAQTTSATRGIVHLDTLNPSNSTIVFQYDPSSAIRGLTASPYCNILVGIEVFSNQIVYINLIDGTIIPICTIPENFEYLRLISSMYEFIPTSICEVFIDLDCNDSSGATDSDFNSPDFDCLSDGSGIADEDINLFFDALISSMTIRVTGYVPDFPEEILDIYGSVANINVTGAGTDELTLINAGGATSRDFKDALRLVLYRNTDFYITGGPRTVEVQFTTTSGMMSNVATAYINVVELPLLEVDLGPDVVLCGDETATFNAGNPQADYFWSTGETSQSITVSESGEYTVTVSNGIKCPNKDTVLVEVRPMISVYLSGPDSICDNEDAAFIIINDAEIPITIEVSSSTGDYFMIDEKDVNGNYTFTDSPNTTTGYTITNVTASEPACIEITEPYQLVQVFSPYESDSMINICGGDSAFIAGTWQTVPGLYEVNYVSQAGCDSIVMFTLGLLPTINVSILDSSCNFSQVGVFTTFIDNPNGCDTIVQTTVTFIASDTTSVLAYTCNTDSTGVVTESLVTQDGCDSIVITTVQLIHDQDITVLLQTSCDSSSLGVILQTLSSVAGCDSMVLTITEFADGDSTYLTGTSCDSSSLGVFEDHYISQAGCDSIVFITITYSTRDSTYIYSSSCDPNDIGVFTSSLINQYGCDSIVTENIGLIPIGETFIYSSTCDPLQAGIFTEILISADGCDSIVTETIGLLPGDETQLQTTTCMSSEAGEFITLLTNQYGCDSIVTLIVSLIPADTSILSFYTCDLTQVGSIEEIFINHDGCDSLVISETSLYPLPVLNVLVTSDYNGYAISCFGETDGSVVANVTGIQAFSYSWSTGSTDQSITNLQEGVYSVTITDANGCMAESEVILDAPSPFSISFIVSQPDCFKNDKGSITVEQTSGIEPIRYSIDGINYQSTPTFSNLPGGSYQITALDGNDCEVREIIWINVPVMVQVDLGDDLLILPGDTTMIEAIVNVPYDSLVGINWSGLLNPDCPNCLTQTVAPIITTTYSVSVTSADGCSDKDSMTLYLEQASCIYIPNIFSPNGDNINDRVVIHAGPEVEKISSFNIFDRWGNQVFAAFDFFPNDSNSGWDGRSREQRLNPAVFAYKLIVQFKDGRQELRYGDITLIR